MTKSTLAEQLAARKYERSAQHRSLMREIQRLRAVVREQKKRIAQLVISRDGCKERLKREIDDSKRLRKLLHERNT